MLLRIYGSLRSCSIFFNFCWHQHATLCGFWSTYGSPRSCWVLDSSWLNEVPFSISFVDSCPPTGLSVLENWVFGFGWIRWVSLPASSDFWIQFNHPIIFVRNLRWWSKWHIYFLVYDFFRFHNNYCRDTTSWEYIVKDDCDKSCLTELLSFPLSKPYIDPLHRIVVPFPLLLARCRTWFGQIKLLRISVFLIHGIHGCKEYRLSLTAWILSTRYQSWICDGV